MRTIYLSILIVTLLFQTAPAQQPHNPIHFRKGVKTRLPDLMDTLPATDILNRIQFRNHQYVLIQFDELPDQSEREIMLREGIRLFDYIPGKAFFAEIPGNTSLTSLRKYKASGVFSIEPQDKISDKLIRGVSSPEALVAVHYFGTIAQRTIAEELKKAGAQLVETKIRPEQTIFVRASQAVIQKIAALSFVSYIGVQVIKDQPLNQNSRGVHGVHALQIPTGRNLQGSNVTIGIGDNGSASTHIDFTGRLINRTPFPPANHGTHVTGTAAGGGILNAHLKGMAPQATIVSQFYSDILVNTPVYLNDYGMVLTNNSYYSGLDECPGNGEYDVLSNFADNQMLDYPELLHVFAAGNDGALTCSPWPSGYGTIKSGFQSAKNVLTVGGVSNLNYTPDGNASRGPVLDGRLKPELVAGSVSVNSTRINNGYGNSWGTSMAAPTVTGAVALLYERYRQLNGGSNPPAALIKAAVVNGAVDLGNPGPDYTFGFGTLHARNAVEIIENANYFTATASQGSVGNFTITGVPAGVYQLKVLLYWADPAASPNAAMALVNNLDLTVTAPGPAVHQPLVLNPAPGNVNDPAAEGTDNVNNIEQIVINNPPAGDFDVTVTGTVIPSGNQDFFVVYQLVYPGVTVEQPSGSEQWAPAQTECIRWHANDGDEVNTFTIEYSTDNGSTWTPISTSVDAATRVFYWPVPNTPSTTARVRVTRNNTGASGISPDPFTIMQFPNLTATAVCPGYATLTWGAVPTATSYDVLQLRGNKMEVIANTTTTNYLVKGLSQDSIYYFAIQPMAGTVRGRQSIARAVTPNAGTCALSDFNNDFSPDSLIAPLTGRMHTSTQPGTQTIQVRVRNLDDAASTGSFDISYQVNGGLVVTENSTQIIPAISAYTFTFAQTYDFSATGTYTIKIWVDHAGDGQQANDTLVHVIKHLQNDPLVLSPSFTEGFETADIATYTTPAQGLNGTDRCDFIANTSNGRARTFVNTGFARSGDRALTLDQQTFSPSPNADSLTLTFNLSGYSPADQLWLDFYYRNQGIDFSLPGNQVWIRGSDLDSWIPAYTIPANDPTHFGTYRHATPINITETLADAVPAQLVSSSFQVRFGQEGFTSANSVITDGNLDDGLTFDDIIITNAQNDVGIQALVSPDLTSICGLSATETVRVRVKNYSDVTVNNVAVSYTVNSVTVNEVIPSLTAGQVLEYTFSQTANLAAFQQYTLDAWVHYPADNYNNNDSLLNMVFHTTPTITNYPYLEDFESSNGYWYTGGIVSSWEWGAPSNTVINEAASGLNAWVTALAGNYNNSELSYLYSPCFDLSGLTQPVLSFSHIFRMEDDCDCDFHWVEYSLDDVTWTKLGNTTEGTNWYDHAGETVWQLSNTRWHVASFDIPVTPSKVRLRIVMNADPALSFEGVGIDDVHIFDKAAVYTGADVTSGLTQTVSGSNWTHFTMGSNRIVSVNPNGQDLGSTSVEVYFNNTGNDRFSNEQYYLDRNIVINPTNVPLSPVTVRFYFTDEEVNNLITATGCPACTAINDAYEAGVTQYSHAVPEENGTLGDNVNGMYVFIPPGSVSVRPYDNGYYAEYEVSNFSEFWINSGGPGQNQPLPVQLGSFTVTKQNNTGLLEWTTLQESNSDRFMIEKSTDGVTYQNIGQVAAAGTSTTTLQYSFTDPSLANGINYYRLRIIDINDQFTFSPVRMLIVSNDELLVSIYPNPVQQGILYINSSVNCQQVIITDVWGRRVQSFTTAGTHQEIPVFSLARGTYFVTVVTDKGKVVQKVVR